MFESTSQSRTRDALRAAREERAKAMKDFFGLRRRRR